MFLAQTPSHIFYTAGKIGTQTLMSIPDIYSIDIATKSYSHNLRKDTAIAIKRLLINDSRNITVIIRDPDSRFISGLYEITAKEIYGSLVVSQATLGAGIDAVKATVDLFYKTEFWEVALDKTLRLRPSIWQDQLDGYRWQFHVGNWLEDVTHLLNHAAQIGRNITIVDITDLSKYLKHHSLDFDHHNSYDSMMWRLRLIPGYDNFYSSIDQQRIRAAWTEAYHNTNKDLLEVFNQYLKPERNLYKALMPSLWK